MASGSCFPNSTTKKDLELLKQIQAFLAELEL